MNRICTVGESVQKLLSVPEVTNPSHPGLEAESDTRAESSQVYEELDLSKTENYLHDIELLG